MIEPLDTAIRRVLRLISEAEWNGSDATPLRTLLQVMLAAKDRGERWFIPF